MLCPLECDHCPFADECFDEDVIGEDELLRHRKRF